MDEFNQKIDETTRGPTIVLFDQTFQPLERNSLIEPMMTPPLSAFFRLLEVGPAGPYHPSQGVHIVTRHVLSLIGEKRPRLSRNRGRTIISCRLSRVLYDRRARRQM